MAGAQTAQNSQAVPRARLSRWMLSRGPVEASKPIPSGSFRHQPCQPSKRLPALGDEKKRRGSRGGRSQCQQGTKGRRADEDGLVVHTRAGPLGGYGEGAAMAPVGRLL